MMDNQNRSILRNEGDIATIKNRMEVIDQDHNSVEEVLRYDIAGACKKIKAE